MEKYLMAIDAGTGSVRVILFDTLGNERFVAQSEWTHHEDQRYPGSMDFDIDQNIGIIMELIKEIFAKSGVQPETIAAISTTSMREAIVLYDEDGKELWACANVDSRANDEVAKLYKISDTIETEIHHLSGQTFSLGAIPRILWVKKNIPETYDKIKYVTMLNDWITYRLTGVISVEPSNGCTTGLFDLKKRAWDPGISEKVGLRSDIFPVVNESGSIIGHVTEEFAALTGLSTKTLVVAGGGDAQLGCIGMGVIGEGEAAVLGGSFWQYEYTTSQVEINDACKVRVNCHSIPNTWQYEAIAFFPGLIMRWFRDTFCELEAHLQQETGESIYAQMEKRAKQVPAGCHGMICTFSDKMNYFSWKHAAPSFIDFKFNHSFTKATFYRAIMENAAFVTKGNMDEVFKTTNKLPDSIVFGGGASKSDLWCQIVADVLNMKVKVPVVKESTALGAAICAGVGAGVYESFHDAIERVVKFEKTFEPNESNHSIYEELYKKWEAVYKVHLALADEGMTDHMWIAPGL
ncbi:autoinducer-2 kinase [Neobacillus mesonae]|uniref:autoinducer-2 kinase n=1 Tax=Neobacillus mesonae TaxID=1193713 RepID=UPI00203E03D6|nr:autoinducer-2 kinase [Neobacillus mesonae]MCM3570447.1 autoinducer-2 kinase [Neobacillus mesonae]